ncbi:MMPL family transporter [Burkholderia sp. L27(2015)]|uniref:MMPL family transporter n=1 Tax=Burkholderia sp. L27(2015) TaxID=1641858 RepID=UPI00131AE907|nr:MMPL family transporter [Burkholderia sp. L27(2015)]
MSVRSRSRVALVIWALLMASCAVMIARAHYTADLSAFLPNTPSPEQQLMVSLVRDGPASRTVLLGIDGGSVEQRASASQQLADALRRDPQFSTIQNGNSPADAQAHDQQLVFAHRYLLSPAVDAQRFTASGLHTAIGNSIDLLSSPAGMSIAPLLARDPTGETLQLIDSYNQTLHPASRLGVWSSRDGQRALLIVQIAAPGSDTDAQQQALAAVQRQFARAAGAAPLHLVISGPPSFAVNIRQTIRSQVIWLSSLGSGLIVVFLLFVYRSPTTLLLGLLPVLSGAAAGVAAVSAGFGTVHGLTLGFGTTLIGEAVDYSIYLFIQSGVGLSYPTQNSPTQNPSTQNLDRRLSDWVKNAWPTVRLGTLTSIFGFASLTLSGFPGLAQLGVYSISGLVVAAAVTRWVLPALIPASLRPRDVTGFGRRLIRLIERARRWRAAVAVLALAAVALLALHHHRLWNTELAALSPISAADQALDAQLRSELGAPDAVYFVVVRGTDVQSALQGAERVTPALHALASEGVIQNFESPSRYLPSVALQRARQAALPERAVLSANLDQATQGLPLRATKLSGFLDDVEAARHVAPLTPADVHGSSLAAALDALLLCHANQCDALLPLRAPSGVPGGIDHARIRQALNQLQPESPGDLKPESTDGVQAEAPAQPILFIDLKEQTDRLYAGYLHQAIWLSAAGLMAIIVLLALALRSARRMVRVIAPLAAAVVVVAALLTLSGAQLTLLHLVGMLLVVALGSNYALFFEAAHDRDARGDSQVDSQLDPRGMQPATVASLLFANLSTIAGFGVLAFSSVPLLRSFGETVAPGALLVLLFSAMLSRPLSSLLTQSTSPPISRATNSATSIAAKAHADETEVLR